MLFHSSRISNEKLTCLQIREFWACLERIDYEDVMKNEARYSVKSWQKALQSASF